MVHFQIDLHHGIDFHHIHAAGNRHAQGVAQECDGMMVFQKFGVLGEDLALVRFVDIFFEFGRARFASVIVQLVNHFQVIEIESFMELATAENARNAFGDGDQYRQRIGDQYRPQCRTENNEQLGRLHEHLQIAVLHQVTANDCAEHGDNA